MKTYRGNRGTAPATLNHDTRERDVINIKLRPLYTQEIRWGWACPTTGLAVSEKIKISYIY
jgi:hypothetical protein